LAGGVWQYLALSVVIASRASAQFGDDVAGHGLAAGITREQMVGGAEFRMGRLDISEHLVAAPVAQTQLLSARCCAERDEQIVSV
jgi:hypothetical protein